MTGSSGCSMIRSGTRGGAGLESMGGLAGGPAPRVPSRQQPPTGRPPGPRRADGCRVPPSPTAHSVRPAGQQFGRPDGSVDPLLAFGEIPLRGGVCPSERRAARREWHALAAPSIPSSASEGSGGRHRHVRPSAMQERAPRSGQSPPDVAPAPRRELPGGNCRFSMAQRHLRAVMRRSQQGWFIPSVKSNLGWRMWG